MGPETGAGQGQAGPWSGFQTPRWSVLSLMTQPPWQAAGARTAEKKVHLPNWPPAGSPWVSVFSPITVKKIDHGKHQQQSRGGGVTVDDKEGATGVNSKLSS